MDFGMRRVTIDGFKKGAEENKLGINKEKGINEILLDFILELKANNIKEIKDLNIDVEEILNSRYYDGKGKTKFISNDNKEESNYIGDCIACKCMLYAWGKSKTVNIEDFDNYKDIHICESCYSHFTY